MTTIFGTSGNDNLRGTAAADTLFGLAGNDLIFGGNGPDFIDGGVGDDIIRGGNGRNSLFGGEGNDLIDGGDAADFIHGGAGNDGGRGGAGNDRIFGGDGNDVFLGEAGDDELDGGAGDDLLDGGAGHDSLRGGDGADVLIGFGGDDFLQGGDGADVVDGGQGRDRLFGDGGNDNLRGGDGDDELHGGGGIDAILGEGGSDRIFAGDGNDSVDGDAQLRFYFLGANNTLVVAQDPAQLSQLTALTISGLPQGVQLRGLDRRPADDQLYALGTDNVLYRLDYASGAATAVSTLNTPFLGGVAEAGIGFDFNPVPDRLRLVGSSDRNFRINVDTGAVADNNAQQPGVQPDKPLQYIATDINAGQNPNIVAVAYTNNVPGATTTQLFGIDSDRNTLVRILSPNDGTLATVGSLGIDALDNASLDILTDATGTINVAVLINGGLAYRLDLATGQTTLLGPVGDGSQSFQGFAIALVADATQTANDQIFGGQGDDVLSGNLGDDQLYGEQGNDRLLGGAGHDLLVGGEGADSFIFQSLRSFQIADFGLDTLVDFQPGVDKIVLSQRSFGPLDFGPSGNSFVSVTDDSLVAGSSSTIVYSQASGQLFFNQNGSAAGLGTGGAFLHVVGHPNLRVTDFVAIA